MAAEEFEPLRDEVEALLSRFAGELDVPAPPAVVERVKSAIAIDLNEAWLNEQEQSEASPMLVQRVQRVVRDELGQAGPRVAAAETGRRPVAARTWPRSWGAWAAAAMVACCIGIIRYAGLSAPSTVTQGGSKSAITSTFQKEFVEAAQAAVKGDTFTASILSELNAIQQQMVDWRSQEYQGQEEILKELDQAFDEVFDETTPAEDSVGWRPGTQGAIG